LDCCHRSYLINRKEHVRFPVRKICEIIRTKSSPVRFGDDIIFIKTLEIILVSNESIAVQKNVLPTIMIPKQVLNTGTTGPSPAC